MREGSRERWDVVGGRAPKNVTIDVEVRVNQTIPHARHARPWHFAHRDLGRLRDTGAGFTYDLHGANQSEEQHFVRIQFLAAAACDETSNGLAGIENMKDPDAIFRLHTATAPRA